MAPGSTERWGREGYPERGPRRYGDRPRGYSRRYHGRRTTDATIAFVCVLFICVLGLLAWLGMTLTQPTRQDDGELPTHRVTHDSMCATNTYNGELIRWYVIPIPTTGFSTS